MQRCWAHEPSSRPKISEVALQLLTLSVCGRLVGHVLDSEERLSLIATIFLGNERVGVVGQTLMGDAQTLVDVIDDVSPCTVPCPEDSLIQFFFSIRCCLALHQRPAGGACAIYTGFAITMPCFRDH